MLDLLHIARTEHEDGDLFGLLEDLFRPAKVQPEGYDGAIIWEGGNHDGSLNPVAHALTDSYALLGTLAAIDILDLPYYAVPMWSQYRHDQKLAPLDWFGNMPCVSIKWSTAGDALVNDLSGGKTVVMGKSGNAYLRKQAGVYCNIRPYGNITVVRCMPCLPYSQNKSEFKVNEDSGMIHSEMNTPGIQMAYAGRHFLQMVHETDSLGRVAFKPTIAEEDGINAGLLSWLLKDTKFKVGRKYAVDYYDEHREHVNRIVALLPEDFKADMENWEGHIDQHISDTNYGLLLWDMIDKTDVIILTTDLDGDRLTDLLADVSDPLRHFGQLVLDHTNSKENMAQLWYDMGYTTGNGRDMTSVMYRMDGLTIREQTLGTADAMVLRLLDGDESLGGTKKPYDPRIHFVLIRDAYLDANPGNERLRKWLDNVIQKFDEVYTGDRPGFIEGYKQLKEKIKPWCPEDTCDRR